MDLRFKLYPVHRAGHQAEVGHHQQADTGHPDDHYHRTSLQHCVYYLLSTVSTIYCLESGEMNHVVTGTDCSMNHAAPRTPLHWEHGEISPAHPHTGQCQADGHTLTQLRRGDERTHAINGGV